jgi:hypothetical protein
MAQLLGLSSMAAGGPSSGSCPLACVRIKARWCVTSACGALLTFDLRQSVAIACAWGALLRSCPARAHRALARHKQSTGLFVSGLSPPRRAAPAAPPNTSLRRAPQSPAQAPAVACQFVARCHGGWTRAMGTGRSEVLGGGTGKAGPGGHERSPVPVGLVSPQNLTRPTVASRMRDQALSAGAAGASPCLQLACKRTSSRNTSRGT